MFDRRGVWFVLLCATALSCLHREAHAQAANDECGAAVAVTDGSNAVSNVGSTGSGTPPSCFTTDGDTWYSYTASCDGTVSFRIAQQMNDDLVIAVYDGCALTTELGCNDAVAPGICVSAVAGDAFVIQVEGFGATAGDAVLEVACAPAAAANDDCLSAVSIPDDGSGVGAAPGASTASGVSPTCGTGGTTDQWFSTVASSNGTLFVRYNAADNNLAAEVSLAIFDGCGGSEIICAQDGFGDTLTTTVAAIAGATYWIQVAAVPSATCDNGILSAELLTTPANDICAGAISIVDDGSSNLGNTIAATASGVTPTCSLPTNSDLWFTTFASTDGSMVVRANPTDFNTLIDVAVYDSCGGSEIACGVGAFTGDEALASFSALNGVQYWIRASTDAGDAIAVTAETFPSPVNDDCSFADTIPDNGTANPGSTFGATASTTIPTCAVGAESDVWFILTTSDDGSLEIECDSADFNTTLNLSAFDSCGGSEIGCDAAPFSGNPVSLSLAVTAGTTLLIRVSSDIPDDITITAETFPTPPNDFCGGATTIAADGSPNAADTIAATNSGVDASCGLASQPDVWFRVVAIADGTLAATFDPGAEDCDVSIFDACGGSEIACNTGMFGDSAGATAMAVAGQELWIRASTFAGDTGSISAIFAGPIMNDTCGSAEVATDGTVGFDTLSATISGVDSSCGSVASEDVWYEYSATCDGIASFGITTATYDSLLAAYSGPCATPILLNCDDTGGAGGELVEVPVMTGETILVQVSGWNAGDIGAGSLDIACTATAVRPDESCGVGATEILVPGNVTYDLTGSLPGPGDPTCFTLGNPDIWFRYTMSADGAILISDGAFTDYAVWADCPDGTNVALACGDQSVTAGPLLAGEEIFIQVSDFSAATTGSFDLSEFTPAANDECSDAVVLSDGMNAASNLDSTFSGTNSLCGPAGSADTWYEYTATCSGNVAIDTGGSGFDTTLAAYSDCGLLTELACDDDGFGFPLSVIGVPVTAGDTILVRLFGFDQGTGNINVTCLAPAPNDTCVSADVLVDDGTVVNGTTSSAANEGVVPSCSFITGPSVWYEVVPSQDGILQVTATAPINDLDLALYSSCGGAEVACADDGFFGGDPESTSVSVTSGMSVFVRVSTSPADTFTITAETFMPAANDTCGAAQNLATNGIPESFLLSTATDSGTVSSCGIAGGNDVWYEITPSADGTLAVSASTTGDASISTFDSCGGTEIDCVDDGFGGAQESFSLTVTAGDTLYVRVTDDGVNGLGSIQASLVGDVTGKVVVVDGDLPGGIVDSAAAVIAALNANGVSSGDIVTFPPSILDAPLLGVPSGMFLLLGTDIFANGTVLTGTQGQTVKDLVVGGMPLYLEGADHFDDISLPTPLDDVDGVDNMLTEDGGDLHQGMVGADLFLGLDNLYTQDSAGGDFTDELVVATLDMLGTDAAVLWSDDGSGGSTVAFDTAIRYTTQAAMMGDPEPGNVIASSSEFGGWYEGDAMEHSNTMALMLTYLGISGASDPSFIRGDMDMNGQFTLQDPILLLGFLFTGSSTVPNCLATADITADGMFGLPDVVALLQFQFAGGSAPAAPNVCGESGDLAGVACDSDNDNCIP